MPNAVERFEREFAAWLGVAGAVATGYGRGAAFLACKVLAAADESTSATCEVLIPDFICRQVTDAVRAAGAQPRFYRVPQDLVIHPDDLSAAATPCSRVALIPHYFGRVQPRLRELLDCCSRLGLVPVEDCALTLGATGHDGRLAGASAPASIFSMTKDHWCFGGGALVARDAESLKRAEMLRSTLLNSSSRGAMPYGLLRCADFTSNRPSRAFVAEHLGRSLERLLLVRGNNFFDTGRFDSAMPRFAAQRARRILRDVPQTVARRRRIHAAFRDALRATPLLFRPDFDPGDSGSFLLLLASDGNASQWREEAAALGVTLRLVWPAYQHAQPEQASAHLVWFAEHLLYLEIHPRLTEEEVGRIISALKSLGGLS